ATWPRALDRARLDHAALQADKALRRQAQNGIVATKIHIARERRGTGGTKGAIGSPWISAIPGFETLGVVHLVAIAGTDVVVDALDGATVGVAVDGGPEIAVQNEAAPRGVRRRLRPRHRFK